MEFYESPAYGELCRNIYGFDMKQMGMVTKDELDLLYKEVNLASNSNILDMGCGSGHMTAAIANHYKSFATGIDIKSNLISYAKDTFSNNRLEFKQLDFNSDDFEEGSFDLICFFDTLYFTFSIENLRTLLDKCLVMLKAGGRIVVFWTNQPNESFDIFKMTTPTARNTQVGIWGIDNHIHFKSFDLSKAHRLFWVNALLKCKEMEHKLMAEIPDHYQAFLNECTHMVSLSEKGDVDGLFRWLYIFTKAADIDE